MEEFTLTIIGSGSALPMHGRHPSAQVIQYDDFCCLIDCGEGTQDRLRPAGIRPFSINMILISHLHGDHVFGLPGLISSFTHLGRTAALTIYGPKGLKSFLEQIIQLTEMRISFPLSIVEQSPEGVKLIHKMEHLELMTFPLFHRIACNGYLFRETGPKIKFSRERIHQFEITPAQMQSLKRGEEIVYKGGKLAASFFIDETIQPVSYAYCSDTRYDERVLGYVRGTSVLYHETTFMNDMAGKADQTGHTTAGEAGFLASRAGVSCLVTGHYSSRYKEVNDLVAEAREHFGHVIQAEEGKKYNLRKLAKGLH